MKNVLASQWSWLAGSRYAPQPQLTPWQGPSAHHISFPILRILSSLGSRKFLLWRVLPLFHICLPAVSVRKGWTPGLRCGAGTLCSPPCHTHAGRQIIGVHISAVQMGHCLTAGQFEAIFSRSSKPLHPILRLTFNLHLPGD